MSPEREQIVLLVQQLVNRRAEELLQFALVAHEVTLEENDRAYVDIGIQIGLTAATQAYQDLGLLPK